MRRLLAVVFLSLLVAACEDGNPTDPLTPVQPDREISDFAHGSGIEGFYFLPPLVPDPAPGGTFNPLVQPLVHICELDRSVTPATCGAEVVEYTLTSGTDGATLSVSAEDEHYRVNWNTGNYDLDPDAAYRINVFLTEYEGSLKLGHADVELGSNAGELRSLNRDTIVPLVDGQTLPIKFRIENGAGCDGELDCGEGTIGSDGGTVTTANGGAGVAVPEGAVIEPITITIRQLDPAQQPGGRCLPTGLRQDGACYDFDTEQEISEVTGGSPNFLADVTVGVCPSPNATREDRLTLHKYNPERPGEGVVELPGTGESFLRCDQVTGPGYVATGESLLGRLAGVTRRALMPLQALLPQKLYARDTGLAGLTDSFSRVSWAESITLGTAGVPGSALPGDVVTGTVAASTAHNASLAPVPGTDAQLRFDYIDPAGATSAWNETTDGQGEVPLSWPLTNESGVHTLVVSSRDVDPSLDGAPLIDDPTPNDTLRLIVCESDLDCGLGTVDGDGGTVTTTDASAGVFFPQGAVTRPVTVTIEQLDPAQQPGGRCLPTGLRQDGACYDFDTVQEISEVTGSSPNFLADVTVGVCPSPNATREDRLTLHKYNPERPDDGVVELDGTSESFLDCSNLTGPGYVLSDPGWLKRLANAVHRTVRPAVDLLAPKPLHARDTGLAGLTDSFSRVSWAEPIDIATAGAPSTALPGDAITVTIDGTTAHNEPDLQAVAATDAQLRIEYIDATETSQDVWFETTDAAGQIEHSWTLTQQSGTHLLVISSRDHDPALQGSPLIDDPTTPDTVVIEAVTDGVTITGTVQYAGTGLEGVEVELVPGDPTDPPAYTGTTDSDGIVVFSGVTDGSYHFKAYGPTAEYIGWKATSITVAGSDIAQTLDLPKTIVLQAPENNVHVSTRQPTLTWTSNPEASSYTVQVNVTDPWTLVEQNTSVPTNSAVVQTALTAGQDYTWQVDAYDGAGRHVGTTETAFTFTVFTVDQVSDATTGTTLGMPVGQTGSLYQSFTPGATPLAAVRLRLRSGGSFPSNGFESTVNVRSSSPTGPVLASATEFIPGPQDAGTTLEVTYAFPDPPALTPGETYVIEWLAPESAVLSWYVSDADPYAGGTAFGADGNRRAGEDFIFRTYSP